MSLKGQTFDYRRYKNLFLPLLGEHQRVNAITAIESLEVCQEFQSKISLKAVRQGLNSIYWPLRFEIIRRKPAIILDAAHTPESMRQLVATIREFFPKNKMVIVFGVSEDKDRKVMCRFLNRLDATIVATAVDNPRAHRFTDEELKKSFPKKRSVLRPTITEALKAAHEESNAEAIILITGSIYLTSAAREIILKQ